VPEELTFDQVVANGPTVHDDEGLVFAVALLVEGARKHVLTRASFALDQHRSVGRCDPLQHAKDAAHRQARTEHVSELGRLARQNLSAVGIRPNNNFHAADGNGGPGVDERFANGSAADTRVIRGAEVAHQDSRFGAFELTVMAGHGVVGQHQVVVLALTDAQPLSHFDALAARSA
jgi:hypothetical protein